MKQLLGRGVVVLCAALVGGGIASGLALASGKAPTAVAACVNAKDQLSLVDSKGKCASGTSPLQLSVQGPKGDPGPAGPAGHTILNGSTPPAKSQGVAGDYYLQNGADVLWGPKIAYDCVKSVCQSKWPAKGVSLVGPPGTPATNPNSTGYQTTAGTTQLPNGDDETVATQTIPVAGWYYISATATVDQTGGNTADWGCDLGAANPEFAATDVGLGALISPGLQNTDSVNIVTASGMVDVDANATVTLDCSESVAQKDDQVNAATIDSIPLGSVVESTSNTS